VKKQWYEELFTNFAETYDKESFVQGTLGEVDFIEQEIAFDKSKITLDIGCGTGRHSIELAKRGYTVEGFDLSESQIACAKRKAAEAGVAPHFFVQDARTFSFPLTYDVALMLCEGSFPLMETDEMNFAILRNAFNTLKPGGKFIFTTLNGLFPLFHSVKDFINKNSKQGTNRAGSFDLMTFRDHSVYETADDDGHVKRLNCNERYYVPAEITWLLKSLGFVEIGIFGCSLGEWSRAVPLTTNDYEMLVIAKKPL
jgi:2-polyprenyl-3-methyl-5-hydroxy-6-metoxy-1,4-benzoquinol methylase